MKCIKFIRESSGGVFAPGEIIRMSNDGAEHYVNYEKDAVYVCRAEWKAAGRARVNM